MQTSEFLESDRLISEMLHEKGVGWMEDRSACIVKGKRVAALDAILGYAQVTRARLVDVRTELRTRMKNIEEMRQREEGLIQEYSDLSAQALEIKKVYETSPAWGE